MAFIYDIGFQIDNRALQDAIGPQLNVLRNEIQEAFRVPTTGNLAAPISEAIRQAGVLRQALEKATTSRGISFASLNMELRQAGTSASQLLSTLAAGGPAFAGSFQVALTSLATANTRVLTLSQQVEDIGRTLANSAKYFLTTSAYRAIFTTLSDAVKWAQELNSTLTDISIVTGKTGAELDAMYAKIIENSRALRVSADDYAAASQIFYQQGLDDAEVERRTEITVKSARAAGQSIEDMSKQLTAIWNTYGMQNDEMERAASVAARLGAESAVLFKDIATAMQTSASAASQMGVSYETLAAIIATVGETTQQSASTVGNAFKTIFSRFQQLEVDTKTGSVELKKLSQEVAMLGVQLLDSAGNLRPLEDIILETGAAWDTYTQKEQVALAQLVGGTRQYGQFLALMNNFDRMLDLRNRALTEDGSALEGQYQRSLQSIESAAENAREAWMVALRDVFDQDLIRGFWQGLEKSASIMKAISNTVGGIQGAFQLLIVYLSRNIPSLLNSIGNLITTTFSNPLQQAQRTTQQLLSNFPVHQLGFGVGANRQSIPQVGRVDIADPNHAGQYLRPQQQVQNLGVVYGATEYQHAATIMQDINRLINSSNVASQQHGQLLRENLSSYLSTTAEMERQVVQVNQITSSLRAMGRVLVENESITNNRNMIGMWDRLMTGSGDNNALGQLGGVRGIIGGAEQDMRNNWQSIMTQLAHENNGQGALYGRLLQELNISRQDMANRLSQGFSDVNLPIQEMERWNTVCQQLERQLLATRDAYRQLANLSPDAVTPLQNIFNTMLQAGAGSVTNKTEGAFLNKLTGQRDAASSNQGAALLNQIKSQLSSIEGAARGGAAPETQNEIQRQIAQYQGLVTAIQQVTRERANSADVQGNEAQQAQVASAAITQLTAALSGQDVVLMGSETQLTALQQTLSGLGVRAELVDGELRVAGLGINFLGERAQGAAKDVTDLTDRISEKAGDLQRLGAMARGALGNQTSSFFELSQGIAATGSNVAMLASMFSNLFKSLNDTSTSSVQVLTSLGMMIPITFSLVKNIKAIIDSVTALRRANAAAANAALIGGGAFAGILVLIGALIVAYKHLAAQQQETIDNLNESIDKHSQSLETLKDFAQESTSAAEEATAALEKFNEAKESGEGTGEAYQDLRTKLLEYNDVLAEAGVAQEDLNTALQQTLETGSMDPYAPLIEQAKNLAATTYKAQENIIGLIEDSLELSAAQTSQHKGVIGRFLQGSRAYGVNIGAGENVISVQAQEMRNSIKEFDSLLADGQVKIQDRIDNMFNFTPDTTSLQGFRDSLTAAMNFRDLFPEGQSKGFKELDQWITEAQAILEKIDAALSEFEDLQVETLTAGFGDTSSITDFFAKVESIREYLQSIKTESNDPIFNDSAIERMLGRITSSTPELNRLSTIFDELAAKSADTAELEKWMGAVDSLSGRQQERLLDIGFNFISKPEDIQKALNGYNDFYVNVVPKIKWEDDAWGTIEAANQLQEAFDKSIKNMGTYSDELTLDQVQGLINSGFGQYIASVGDKFMLTKEAAEAYNQALDEEIAATKELLYGTSEIVAPFMEFGEQMSVLKSVTEGTGTTLETLSARLSDLTANLLTSTTVGIDELNTYLRETTAVLNELGQGTDGLAFNVDMKDLDLDALEHLTTVLTDLEAAFASTFIKASQMFDQGKITLSQFIDTSIEASEAMRETHETTVNLLQSQADEAKKAAENTAKEILRALNPNITEEDFGYLTAFNRLIPTAAEKAKELAEESEKLGRVNSETDAQVAKLGDTLSTQMKSMQTTSNAVNTARKSMDDFVKSIANLKTANKFVKTLEDNAKTLSKYFDNDYTFKVNADFSDFQKKGTEANKAITETLAAGYEAIIGRLSVAFDTLTDDQVNSYDAILAKAMETLGTTSEETAIVLANLFGITKESCDAAVAGAAESMATETTNGALVAGQNIKAIADDAATHAQAATVTTVSNGVADVSAGLAASGANVNGAINDAATGMNKFLESLKAALQDIKFGMAITASGSVNFHYNGPSLIDMLLKREGDASITADGSMELSSQITDLAVGTVATNFISQLGSKISDIQGLFKGFDANNLGKTSPLGNGGGANLANYSPTTRTPGSASDFDAQPGTTKPDTSKKGKSGSGKKGKTPKKSGSGKKGKGSGGRGSGGKGSGSEKDFDPSTDYVDESDLDKFKERYADINAELEHTISLLDYYSDAADDAWGPQRLKNLAQVNLLLQKQAQIQARRLRETKKYYESDLEKLQQGPEKRLREQFGIADDFVAKLVKTAPNARIQGISSITNIEEIQEYWEKWEAEQADIYNSAVNAYNAAADPSDEAKDTLKAAKDKYEAAKDLAKYEIEKLEQVLESEQLLQERLEEQVELIRNWMANKVREIETKLEFRVMLNDSDIKRVQFLIDQLGDLGTISRRTVYALISEFNSTVDNAKATMQAMQRGFEIIDHISPESGIDFAAKYFGGDNEAWENYLKGNGGLPAEVMDKLEEFKDQLQEYREELYNISQQVFDQYLAMVNYYKDEFEKIATKIASHTAELETYQQLLEFSGRRWTAEGRAAQEGIMQARVDSAAVGVKNSKAQYDMLKREYEATEARLQNFVDTYGDPSLYDEKMAHVYNNLRQHRDELFSAYYDARDQFFSSVSELTTATADAIEDGADRITETFIEGLDGVFSTIDEIMEMYGHQKDVDDFFLDDDQKAYELNALLKEIEHHMEDITDPERLAAYNELIAEINEKLRNGVDLTEDELKILQAQFDLQKMLDELETARTQKNAMRLQRDASGNWNYVYYNDGEDKTFELQQKIEKQRHDIQEMHKDIVKSSEEAWLEIQAQLRQFLRDVDWAMYESNEQYRSYVDARISLYQTQAERYAHLIEAHVTEAGMVYADTTLGIVTNTESMAQAQELYTKNYQDYMDSLKENTQSWQEKVREVCEANGINYDELESTVNDRTAAMMQENDLLRDDIEWLADTAEFQLEQMNAEVDWWADNFIDRMRDIEAEIDALVAKLRELELAKMSDEDIDSTDWSYKILDAAYNGRREEAHSMGGYRGTKISRGGYVNAASNEDVFAVADALFSSDERVASFARRLVERMYNGETIAVKSDEEFMGFAHAVRDGVVEGMGEVASGATGMYTGSWGKNGKLGILHEKELVLSQEDTNNILKAVDMVRALTLNGMNFAAATIANQAATNANSASIKTDFTTTPVAQSVMIDAQFPNVQVADEIQQALNGLINQAVQYAAGK